MTKEEEAGRAEDLPDPPRDVDGEAGGGGGGGEEGEDEDEGLQGEGQEARGRRWHPVLSQPVPACGELKQTRKKASVRARRLKFV